LPEIEELVRVFEEDLSAFKFEQVVEFESFVDTMLIYALQSLRVFNQIKKVAYETMKERVIELCLKGIEQSFNYLNKDERMAFVVKNKGYLGCITNSFIEVDLHHL
jgi:hypothetical protein